MYIGITSCVFHDWFELRIRKLHQVSNFTKHVCVGLICFGPRFRIAGWLIDFGIEFPEKRHMYQYQSVIILTPSSLTEEKEVAIYPKKIAIYPKIKLGLPLGLWGWRGQGKSYK